MQKLPEEIKSIWIAKTPSTNYPTLKKNLNIDVLVIGGGMAGLNAAYFLKTQGLKICLIEAGKIASSTSGNTTAKITSLHELRYDYLIKNFGKKKAQIYGDSNQWAISEFKRIIEKESINCYFFPARNYTFTKSKDDLGKIKAEADASLQLGLPASYEDSIPGVSFKIFGAVKFDNQAYFHPRRYLLKIAEIINKNENIIWEDTSAIDIKEERDFCEVKTPKGRLKAKSIIIATNFPFYDPENIFKSLNRLQSFVVAATPISSYPVGMMIGTRSKDLTYRPYIGDGKEWLIIGERHDETGKARSMNQKFEDVRKLAEDNFQIKSIEYKWGAADTMSSDKIPYIGKMPKCKNIYVTTGFNGWGMTTSLISAKLLTDLILRKKNEWETLYTPERLIRRR